MNKGIVWLSTLLAIATGGLLAYIGSTRGAHTATGISIYAIVIAGTFILQWIAFIPSWLKRSERFFDSMGSVGFILAVWAALLVSEGSNLRSVAITVCITLWAIRLGAFLTHRIAKTGSDKRFNKIKHDFSLLFMTWTLQALWICVTSSAALVAITSQTTVSSIDAWLVVGAVLWILGMGIEISADFQKSRFRIVPENQNKFITEGLWSWSQHPNYFGEILLWIGIAVMAVPTMYQWQFVTLGSPIFVWLLLTRISGIRMLDAKARKEWGADPEYIQYAKRTPKLILWPPKTNHVVERE